MVRDDLAFRCRVASPSPPSQERQVGPQRPPRPRLRDERVVRCLPHACAAPRSGKPRRSPPRTQVRALDDWPDSVDAEQPRHLCLRVSPRRARRTRWAQVARRPARACGVFARRGAAGARASAPTRCCCFCRLLTQVLDTERMEWSQPVVSGVAPSARACHTTTLLGRKVYMLGGYDGLRCFDTLDVLDLVRALWRARLNRVACTRFACAAPPAIAGHDDVAATARVGRGADGPQRTDRHCRRHATLPLWRTLGCVTRQDL